MQIKLFFSVTNSEEYQVKIFKPIVDFKGANESDNDIRQEEIADASEDPHKLLDIDLSK